MSTSVCQTVSANSDVLGIGIRINFYYTMFLLAIVPQTPETVELLTSLYITAGTSGFGLLLTAIIQTAQHQLSLFHAIFIIHILFFLGTGVSPKGRYHWTTGRAAIGLFVQLLSLISLITWGFYLWVNVKHFGSQPECNHQIKYVVFFFTVRATANWLRRLWYAVLVIPCILAAIALSGMMAMILFFLKRVKKEKRAEESNLTTRPTEIRQYVRSHWYFRLDTPGIISAIYSTVMLELTIARNTAHILPNGTNTGPGVVQIDDSWGFGQVLAVVMIFVNFKEVLHYLFGGPARERQAQTEETANQAEGSQPQPATTPAPIPPVQLAAQPHTRHYTGYSTDNYTTHRGGMDMFPHAQGFPGTTLSPAGAPGIRLGLSLTGHSSNRYTSGYTMYNSHRTSLVYGGR